MNPNKDVILITAHTPDRKRKDLLLDLVLSINRDVFDIVVSCNSKIHEDVYDYCDYVLYDKENRLARDYDKKMMLWWANNNFIVNTTEIKNFNHIVAAASLITNGLSLCKSLGYTKVHFLEYDSKILDDSAFTENSNLLDDYSIVFYNHPHGYGLFSSYSVNLNKIPDFWLDTKLERLHDYLKKPNDKILEEYGKHLVVQTPDAYVARWEEYDRRVKTNLFNTDDIEDWVVAVEREGNFVGFSTNIKKGTDALRVLYIINDEHIISAQVHYNVWFTQNLGTVEDVHNIKILVNGVLRNEYDFTKIEKKKYISRNFIEKIKSDE